MHVNRSTTKTHHHMSSHHSKSNWSFGNDEPTTNQAPQRFWNKKTRCWEAKPVASKVGAPAPAPKPVDTPKPTAEASVQTAETKKEAPITTPVPSQENTKPEENTPAVPEPKQRISSNAFACNTRPECGNFITDRPTTRVHAPPGGRSSIQFG
eukprot:CAMPEP_0197536286 /NCGR_PEP_ID=MMETSP1318-20131121/53453_1 /TAXON_ID=552666 /ORGANISM="Partenskyella glossopodia, Strain RCC365" /LENGTH=152 /DNA_ID=CAMNT_0043094135 /DNA_START=99 /DNA_END=557 /DNA_ORIENTATION=-